MKNTCQFKTCPKCGEEKARSEFHKDRAHRDGLHSYCKTCTRIPGHRERARYPDQYHARSVVREAVRAGRLVRQPCELCGDAQAEAHHPDYAKPLDVRWVCRRCHRERIHSPASVACCPDPSTTIPLSDGAAREGAGLFHSQRGGAHGERTTDHSRV